MRLIGSYDMTLSMLFLRRVAARNTQRICEKRLCLERRRLVPEMCNHPARRVLHGLLEQVKF